MWHRSGVWTGLSESPSSKPEQSLSPIHAIPAFVRATKDMEGDQGWRAKARRKSWTKKKTTMGKGEEEEEKQKKGKLLEEKEDADGTCHIDVLTIEAMPVPSRDPCACTGNVEGWHEVLQPAFCSCSKVLQLLDIKGENNNCRWQLLRPNMARSSQCIQSSQ